jgi:hypothetical protein
MIASSAGHDLLPSNALSLPTATTPTSLASLGAVVPGLQWQVQYPHATITSAGYALAAHDPSANTVVAARAIIFSIAEWVSLEAIIIPAPGLVNAVARITAVWIPAGTTPTREAHARSFPGASTRTLGGSLLIADQIRVPAPLSGGLNGRFRGTVTVNYQPVLWIVSTASAPAPNAATTIFLVDIAGTLRMEGPCIAPWS